MKQICGWCGDVMQGDDQVARNDTAVSHGLCSGCARTLQFRGGVQLQKYLNSLDAPVIAVDSDVVVKIANTRACTLFRKRPAEILGHRGGDVFECAYAGLPGGCGRTVHCSACAIRRTVTETYTTGKACLRVPASLNDASQGALRQIELYISTVKTGDVVFLRIDRIASPTELTN